MLTFNRPNEPRCTPRKSRAKPRKQFSRSGARLLGFLRKILKKSRSGWAEFSIKKTAAFLELGTSTVQRAKNELQAAGQVIFVVVTNELGRRGHRLMVGCPTKLKGTSGTLLAWTADGRARHRWDRIGSPEMHELPAQRSGVAPSPNRPVLSTKPTEFATEPTVIFGARILGRISSLETPTTSGGAAMPRPMSPAQRSMIGRTMRRLVACQWDNSKILMPPNGSGGIWDLVAKWIRRGATVTDIERVWADSLRKMHGLCVDLQLIRQDPDLRFTIGSTINQTDRRLTQLAELGRLKHWTTTVCVVE